MTVSNSGHRVHGIDAWRAILLLFGPIVHSARYLDVVHQPGLGLLPGISHLCRMEAFFALAGFVTARAQLSGGPEFLRERLRHLVLPAFATWLLLTPVMNLAMSGTASLDPGRIGHLWFLVDLALFAVVAYAYDAGVPLSRLAFRLPSGRAALMLGFGAILILNLAGRFVANALPFDSDFAKVLPKAPYYGLFFAAGFALSRSVHWQEWLDRQRLAPAAIVMVLAFCILYVVAPDNWNDGGRSAVAKVATNLFVATAAVIITGAIVQHALRVKALPAVARRAAAASYTIYLVHYPILAVLFLLAAPLHLNAYVQFAVSAVLALILSLLVHEQVIRRSAFLAFLFNGKAHPPLDALRRGSPRGAGILGRRAAGRPLAEMHWQR